MVVWIIGLSSAGKTTVGRLLVKLLRDSGQSVVHLDGDELRGVWGDDLGHTFEARRKNHMRITRLCELLDQDDKTHVIATVLSIAPDIRATHRQRFQRYLEVFLDIPLAEARRRDQRGVYADSAEDVVGRDIEFSVPAADLRFGEPEIYDPPGKIARSIFDAMQTSPEKH